MAITSATMSPPWETYQKKLAAFFATDPEVTVNQIEETAEGTQFIRVIVKNHGKADALKDLIRTPVSFGSVSLDIYVEYDPNLSLEEKLRNAFRGNMYFGDIIRKRDEGALTWDATYVMFAPVALQFFDDNLGHPNGKTTKLVEDTARETMNELPGVFYCSANIM